jgi:hypothetical protein
VHKKEHPTEAFDALKDGRLILTKLIVKFGGIPDNPPIDPNPDNLRIELPVLRKAALDSIDERRGGM